MTFVLFLGCSCKVIFLQGFHHQGPSMCVLSMLDKILLDRAYIYRYTQDMLTYSIVAFRNEFKIVFGGADWKMEWGSWCLWSAPEPLALFLFI